MKTLAYALHESGQCDPLECAWCTDPSVPPVHDRPQSVEAGSNLPPGGDGGSSQWRVTALAIADWLTRIAKANNEAPS